MASEEQGSYELHVSHQRANRTGVYHGKGAYKDPVWAQSVGAKVRHLHDVLVPISAQAVQHEVWLLLIDMDVLVLHPLWPLARQALADGRHDIVFATEEHGHDWTSINTGFVFMRATSPVRSFVHEWAHKMSKHSDLSTGQRLNLRHNNDQVVAWSLMTWMRQRGSMGARCASFNATHTREQTADKWLRWCTMSIRKVALDAANVNDETYAYHAVGRFTDQREKLLKINHVSETLNRTELRCEE